jgi:alkanesulfonate monooxygenase
VTFRPIVAQTDELAWAKAHDYVEKIGRTFQQGTFHKKYLTGNAPQNVGSQRLLGFAAQQDVYDRALWMRTAAVTNAGGASTALVGSPETVAAAILDYVDIGADLISIRGYDTLNDAIDYGRHVMPLVRQELAHRETTGQRGSLQAEHLGAYATVGA